MPQLLWRPRFDQIVAIPLEDLRTRVGPNANRPPPAGDADRDPGAVLIREILAHGRGTVR